MRTETRGRPKKAPEEKSESKYTRIDVHLFTIAEARATQEGISTRKWIENLIMENEKKSLES
jgi:predicted HicB family RNase H-like nuclease